MINIDELIKILEHTSNEYGADVNIFIDVKGDISEPFNSRLLGVQRAKDGSIILTNYA